MINISKIRELDSFYTSRILLALEKDHSQGVLSMLKDKGFFNILTSFSRDQFIETINGSKSDILIIEQAFPDSEDLSRAFRSTNSDAAIIWIGKEELPLKKQLQIDISSVLKTPYLKDDLIKAVKKSLGRKVDHEIGMQFFDALFGMQMCTHRDMHQRTFDHAIRTTKVYGGFLLYLMEWKIISLTSWNLKNCLMAALVHDIGKLLLLNGILYKEGRLTKFEYQQVKRHPWYSVTALLGGQDIINYAQEGPVKTVSGYNDKNLSEQVKSWIFSILDGEDFAYDEVHSFFNSMMEKPFIHSLNRDLLYIVFRHHDSINKSYHSEQDLELFSKVIDSPISQTLNPESYLDIVTNALAICDMFDALLDKKRNYRKNPYNKSFALYLIYVETKRNHFFPFLCENFILYIVSHDLMGEENIFSDTNDPEETLRIIKQIDDCFKIAPAQEEEFNRFVVDNSDIIKTLHTRGQEEIIHLNNEWNEYYQKTHRSLLNQFHNCLKEKNLIQKKIEDLTSKEIRVFDMLFQFYYSFQSKIKQERILHYFVDAVIIKDLDKEIHESLINEISNNNPKNISDLNKLFVEKCYRRKDLFETFEDYDEDLLLTEFNQGIRHFHWHTQL